jgi:hypothetical protein
MGRPFDEVIAAYERASNAAPNRAEALHAASRLCRENKRFEEGYEYARRGLEIPPPGDGLSIQQWIYDFGLLDELAVNAYWTERYQECLDACQRLLREGKMPSDMHDRVKKNGEFADRKIRANEQHRLAPPRALYSRLVEYPRVLLAILAKQKEGALPLYLDCIEALDYPKSSISLYIRTNNNTDGTERILRNWVDCVGHHYAAVEFDAADVPESVEKFGIHEWNHIRFQVLGRIRQQSLRRAIELGCDFYFIADVDNFIRRCTLRELVALNLPIVAPLLRSINSKAIYSNYHADITENGYHKMCDDYLWILDRRVRGVLEVPVVHATYLVRTNVASELTYQDATKRHEYVIFSDSARRAGVPQYLDNRQVYGYVTFDEEGGRLDGYFKDGIARARALLGSELLDSKAAAYSEPVAPR